MTLEDISFTKDILLLVVPTIIGIAGLYIGYIRGKKEKEWEYFRIKKSLRDKKLIEGKIATYHDMFNIIGECRAMYVDVTSSLKIDDKESFMKNVHLQMDNTMKVSKTLSLLRFYSNDRIFNWFSEIVNQDKKMWAIFIKRKDKELSDEDYSKIESIRKLSIKYEKSLIRDVKADLGFT